MDRTTTFYQPQLEFKHLVIDKVGVIFASARDYHNKIFNFLIDPNTGIVLEQANRDFRAIPRERARYISVEVKRMAQAIPTYHIQHFDFS